MREASELELTFTQFKTLMLLAHEPEALSVKDVSDRLGISFPAASRAVEPLVQRGIVERTEDPLDRRVKRVRTTKQGDRLVERLIATRIKSFEQTARRLLRDRAAQARRRAGRDPGAARGRPLLPEGDAPMSRLHAITEENRKWWTLGSMCFALFMIMLDNTVVNVALPSIQSDLDASLSALEWTINVYTLTFAVLLVTGGRLGDIFGRRRAFMFGVVVFALSSATAGLAPNATWLVGSRALQGIGAAFMMPATLSIITNAFPAHERGKAIGTWAGVSALALALGPVVGGFLTEQVSWRAIFFLNLPVAALAVFVALFAVKESRDSTVPRTIDFAGVGTLTVGIGALVLALVEGNGWGWGSPRILALLATSVAGLVAFFVVERRVEVPDGGVLVPAQPHVRRHERHRVRRLVRDARHVLLHGALHAEHPGLLAARGRHPLPALDGA